VPLLPRFLIQSELERGELMLASKLPLQESAGYYLVALVENQTMLRLSPCEQGY